MLQRSDEALVAYLDGELDANERSGVEAWLDTDPAARDRLLALAELAALLRGAFDEIVQEAVPARLIAAARGEAAERDGDAEIIPLRRAASATPLRRWHSGFAMAAGLAGLVLGGALTYFGSGMLAPASRPGGPPVQTASLGGWLDNAAGNYKLMVNAGGAAMVDVPASGDNGEAIQKISQNLPQQLRLPDLKPWGLTFRGARLVVLEGKPAAQLIYTTDNKAIGPLTLIVGASKEPDISPTFDKRQDLNLLYWRHGGRTSVLVGQTEIGYLWNIANDVAWQLDAI